MNVNENNSYKVLARKYRPETFKDLVGQAAMVQTLKNAFVAVRIAQAFILTGIRGTGKTTTARIIAKVLNCIGLDQKGGPTVEPCGKCSNCTAIIEGNHFDVLEMDAASRTGVDDIREIIESIYYKASSGLFRVYIIDEVHMLSKNAENAFLKTLEEPPPHIVFILATTEKNKILPTILSRCQIYDFNRISENEIAENLKQICVKEGVKFEDQALLIIAKKSDGSLRDSLTILDRVVNFTNKHICLLYTSDAADE